MHFFVLDGAQPLFKMLLHAGFDFGEAQAMIGKAENKIGDFITIPSHDPWGEAVTKIRMSHLCVSRALPLAKAIPAIQDRPAFIF